MIAKDKEKNLSVEIVAIIIDKHRVQLKDKCATMSVKGIDKGRDRLRVGSTILTHDNNSTLTNQAPTLEPEPHLQKPEIVRAARPT